MAVFEIPLDNSKPAFSIFVDLDGSNFRFFFRWNSRVETWMFDASDSQDVVVQNGNPLAINVPLAFQNRRENKWPGDLIAISESGAKLSRFNLGTDIKLFYREAIDG